MSCWIRMQSRPSKHNTHSVHKQHGGNWSVLLVSILDKRFAEHCCVFFRRIVLCLTHTGQGVLNCDIKSHRIADEGVPVGLRR